MEHLYDKLKEYSRSGYYPYHMPGHKRHPFGNLPETFFSADITEIEGFDNLHQPEGILKHLQKRAALAYGAEESFYLINGSTGGILSAISAALPEGGHILMARNCHKSAYHAAYLRRLQITYLYPPLMREYNIFDAITPQQVEAALKENQGIQAVLIVSPTYEGRIADVEEIAHIVHQRGIPLIVDEAHGAHLGFAEGFARNSCQLGADLVIHSVHKTLASMTQTALLHVNGALINRERLRRFLHIYQSSSPSYILMASIDNALQVVEQQGQELFARLRQACLSMCEKLAGCKCLDFLPLDGEKQDIGKFLISGERFGLSGQQIYDILLQGYHLQLEMAGGSYCLAMFTIGDTTEAYERMTRALLELDQELWRKSAADSHLEDSWNKLRLNGERISCGDIAGRQSPAMFPTEEGTRLPMAQAWDMEWVSCPLEEAIGSYVADFINLYPPGVPLLVPGEQLTREGYECIRYYLYQGLQVQGVDERHCIKRLAAF